MASPPARSDALRIEDVELANNPIGPTRPEKTQKSGLAIHEEVVLTPEETRAERRYVLKLDLIILPLCAVMYFLATLVG
jgi:hypothetical protein